MQIAIGCDHAGYNLKEAVKSILAELGHDYEDFGTYDTSSVDYPDIAFAVADVVAREIFDQGILVCGSGIGMSIVANKVSGIRAALCHDTFSAKGAREHNNANVLCLGERVIGQGLAKEIVTAYLTAEFEGGRHARRIEKIHTRES